MFYHSHFLNPFHVIVFREYEVVRVTIGNPALRLALYLTGVHFRAELQHFGDVSEQKIKYRSIRTREMGGVRL